jgi:uncharacterized protein DUF87/type IV secretory system conjugative DNA transfer VirD4/TraG family protein
MTDYTDTIIDWLGTFATYLPWLAVIFVAGVLVSIIVVFILRLLDRHRLLRQKSVFLGLTPPANIDKSPEATQRLFSVLHGLEASRSLLDKLLGRKVVFSLEVYSAKETGIPYIVRIAEQDAVTFEQILASYLPDARCKRVEDFLPDRVNDRGRVLDIKQTGHFAYPLQSQGELEEHDSMAYLTGAMTKLAPGELIGVQVVVSPTKVRKASEISGRLLHNEEMLHRLGKRQSSAVGTIFNGINTVLFGILTSIGDVVSGPSRGSYRPGQTQLNHKQQAAMGIKPARTLSPLEQKLADAVQHKLNQPLFRVNIRVLIAVDEKRDEKQRIKGIKDWLALFNVPKYQALRVRFKMPLRGKRRVTAYTHRLPSLFNRNTALLAASELADLYHFPHNETTKTENVVKSLSKTLPAPLAVKNGKFDVVLGRNHHHGVSTDIGLTLAERERHVYIVGSTGNGKSTMLEYAIIQDIRNGKGVAVIDPHGDLARNILRHIPEERINDVVYLNPVDIKYPIGFNLLELPKGLDDDELLLEQQRVTEAVISVMRKVFDNDESTGAHRIEDMLRNSIHTAMTIKDATLFTVLKLLRNETYRKRIVADLEDEYLKDFWREEVGKAGAMQRVSMSKGVTSRIDRFRTSPSAKRILEQPKSTINFEDIINSGKILICNFAEGEIGEDTSALFGTAVLAELKMAAERRAKIATDERRPFYVYVDEFQNFATESFTKMLSGSRKYKLFLTIAQQSTAQQETQRMTEALLSNLSTIICFRTGSPADEQLLLSRFTPYIEMGEISNLPTYNFYARLSAITPQEPVSGMTIVLGDKGSTAVAEKVIEASRANYAKEYVEKKKKSKSKKSEEATDTSTSTAEQDDDDLPETDAPATA